MVGRQRDRPQPLAQEEQRHGGECVVTETRGTLMTTALTSRDRIRELLQQDRPWTLQELGDEVGVSRERARQLCVKLERTEQVVRQHHPPRPAPFYGTCAHCGVDFETPGGRAASMRRRTVRNNPSAPLFCTTSCSSRRFQKFLEFSCAGCGKQNRITGHTASMRRYKHKDGRRKGMYCNKRCVGAGNQRRAQAARENAQDSPIKSLYGPLRG